SLDVGDGHLVFVGHARLQDRPEALVVAIDAAEIAALGDAHANVRDFASERISEQGILGSRRFAKYWVRRRAPRGDRIVASTPDQMWLRERPARIASESFYRSDS